MEEENPEEVLEFVRTVTDALLEMVLPDKPKSLTLKAAGERLRILGKIWNLSDDPEEKLMDREGYVEDYQYLHLEAVDMDLTNVKIVPKQFVWLLSVDLSGNLLTNESACPVTMLPNIVALRLNRNRFRDPYLPAMKHLQYLGLNSNRIESLHRIYHPNLETLDLNRNRIREVCSEDCEKHVRLKQLELRGNLIQTTRGIEYVTLVNLYLAQNRINRLEGLDLLVNLERLHLRENPLSDLTGFSPSNSNLRYLNLRKCQLNEVEEIKNLSVLAGLKELVVKGNNFNPEPDKPAKRGAEDEEEDGDGEYGEEEAEEEEQEEPEPEEEEESEEIRLQILTYLPSLKRIDKKLVTREELERAKEMMEEGEMN